MSRTYRKRDFHRNYYCIMVGGHILYQKELNREPTKKEVALSRRDGVKNEKLHWWFNQCNRVNRNEAKSNFTNLSRCEDYDDFSYDPTRYLKKYRGIWWEIY